MIGNSEHVKEIYTTKTIINSNGLNYIEYEDNDNDKVEKYINDGYKLFRTYEIESNLYMRNIITNEIIHYCSMVFIFVKPKKEF